MYIASKKGHDQIVELLLGREADVNHQTKVRLLMLVCVCVCVLLSEVCNFFQCQVYMHNHENKFINQVPGNRLGYKLDSVKLVSVLGQVCAPDN